MRQPSSPPSYAATPLLHPVLQAALDSLDVELEEELVRYRRQRYRQVRHGQHSSSWRSTAEEKQQAGRSPQLPLMGKASAPLEAGVQPQLPAEAIPVKTPMPAGPMPAGPMPAGTVPVGTLPQLGSTDAASGAAPTPASAASSTHLPSLASLASLANLSIAPPLSSHSSGIGIDRTLDRLRDLAITATSPEEWAGDTAEATDQENSELEELPRSDFSDAPDDYLESSEELLQSIAEEQPPLPAARESSLLDSLLTPLGIGSMLLLLLSSATFGYVIMHPSSLDLFNPSQDSSGGKTATGASASPEAFASPLIPDSPNLAAEEFVNLNVDNLSTIPGNHASGGTRGRSPLPATPSTSSTPGSLSSQSTSSQSTSSQSTSLPTAASSPNLAVDTAPAPEAAPTTEAAAPEAAPESPEPAPEPVAVSQPEPISPPAESSPAESSSLPAIDPPAPTTPAPEVATAPAAPTGGTYYVVTPYNGDPSLEQARQAVPEAYVRNFATGASVQLGVFSSAENAQELVQELEAKGIAAEVYQP